MRARLQSCRTATQEKMALGTEGNTKATSELVYGFLIHDTSEASPQTDERVVSGRHPQRTPVRCMESGMVNHSVKWDRRKANRLATKAPRNRSRDERTTDCHRGLEQTRCVGSPIEGDVKRHFSPSTGGGRFSRTSSPLLGLPEHFVWTAFWWRGQSGWSAFRVFHDDRVNAIRLLKLASRSGWQSANHGPIGATVTPLGWLCEPETLCELDGEYRSAAVRIWGTTWFGS